MTAMGVPREIGGLLAGEAGARRDDLFAKGLAPDAERECDEIRVETDGVWVTLQHERSRSAEIKALCAYETKHEGERVGTVHHAMIGPSESFWEEAVASIGRRYSLPALKRCWAGSDGGGWCKKLPGYLHGPEIVHKLDGWHVNRALKTAFPDREDAAPLFDLLRAGEIGGLLDVLALRLDTGYGEREKVRALIRYIKNNREAIEAEAPSMGTMEGTNAHLYAARMKAWGGAWSIRGASDMARIRSALSSGYALPAPRREHSFK